MNLSEPKEWLSFEEAIAYTKRSGSSIKRAMTAGKINKQLVPGIGSRHRIQLWKADLDKVFRATVHVPAMIVRREPNRAEVSLQPVKADVQPVKADVLMPDPLPSWVVDPATAAVVDRLEAIFGRPAQDAVRQKLTWTLDEARTMTGLSKPALRELIEAKPALAIRRGRYTWIKAEALRRELS